MLSPYTYKIISVSNLLLIRLINIVKYNTNGDLNKYNSFGL